MAKRLRRNHLPSFRVKLPLAAVKGEKTITGLVQHFYVHPNQITHWKNKLLEDMSSVLSRTDQPKSLRWSSSLCMPKSAAPEVSLARFTHAARHAEARGGQSWAHP